MSDEIKKEGMEQSQLRHRIISVAKDIAEMVEDKNTDYGSSFEKTLEEYGDLALIIRLSDKLERIKALNNSQEAPYVAESVEDTLRDIAGYCILWLAIARTEQ